ncbi:MAG: hypothetical protein ACFFC7_34980 [Candidatus Hermodarchaeota archaeon]
MAISQALLTKYVSYARQHCTPLLTEEVNSIIEEFCNKLPNSKDHWPVPDRVLESIIKLTEARAKLTLNIAATGQDASVVVSLMENTMKYLAMDRERGIFSTRFRTKYELIEELVELYEKDLPKDQKGRGIVPIDELIRLGNDQNIDADTIYAAIEQLQRDGFLLKFPEGYVKLI